MSFSSSGLLQFPELKDLLAKYAGSAAGRALVEELEPHRDRARLESDLAEAGEAIGYLRETSGAQEAKAGAAIRLRFDQLRDIETAQRRFGSGQRRTRPPPDRSSHSAMRNGFSHTPRSMATAAEAGLANFC